MDKFLLAKQNILIEKAQKVDNFTHIPLGYWIMCERDPMKPVDAYGDTLHLFYGKKLIISTSCTTTSGSYGLKNFWRWNKRGTAIIACPQWGYDTFELGLHKMRMRCLKQIGKLWYYRDGNSNLVAEQIGQKILANYNTNIHCNSYKTFRGIVSNFIGGWSVGCIVCNNLTDYYYMLSQVVGKVSLCITFKQK